MAITETAIYRDAANFFRNYFVTIMLLSLLCTFITSLLLHALSPPAEQFNLLYRALFHKALFQSADPDYMTTLWQGLSDEQKGVLLRGASVAALSSLLGNALMTGSLIVLIQLVSSGEPTSALRAASLSAPLLPRLCIQLFFIAVIVYFGLVFLVLPGIFFTILLALSPIILVQNKAGVFQAMDSSARLVLRHIRVVTPAVLGWIVIKFFLTLIITRAFHGSDALLVMEIVIGVISNLMLAGLLIFLFRLYMLIR